MQTYRITDYGVRPDAPELQTAAIQKVLDLCRDTGGTVVIPKGRFRIAGLRLWPDMTLKLESGAWLIGSEDCEDYEIFDIPDGMQLHTDMEMIPVYYKSRPRKEYRRAMISVYGGKNVSIIGEMDSHIDGSNCSDPNGEEGYRGPHGIFATNVHNLTLMGYTISNCGNFAHQIDTCTNITIKNTTCTGGSDGFHLHCCCNTLIEDSVMHTGDDCIGGINMVNLTMRRCECNTACDVFRASGRNILVEDCCIFGPGLYPHRMTVVPNRYTAAVKNRENDLPLSEGRNNTLCLWVHFASADQPDKSPSENIIFRNCQISNVDRLLIYQADTTPIDTDAYIAEMTFDHVVFDGLVGESDIRSTEKQPLRIRLRDVTAKMRDGTPGQLFALDDPNVTVLTDD